MADTKFTIKCPACGKDMKKVYSKDTGINLDLCLDGCGGMMFDNRELEKIKDTETAEKILQLVKDMNFIAVDKSKTRVCPICKVPMVRTGSRNINIKIDVCNVCGAKFLDNGELKAIVDNENSEKSFNDLATKIAKDILRG